MCIPRMCPRDIIIPLHISPVICVSRVGISVRPYPRHKNILFSVKFLNTVLGTLSRSLIESVGDWLSSRLPPGMKQMVRGNSGDSHISEPSLALFRTGIKQHTKVEYCSARRGMHLSLNSSRDMCNPPPPPIFWLLELFLAEWSYVSQLLNTTSNIRSRWIRRGTRTNVYINFPDHEEVNSPETAVRFKFCLESLLFCRLCCS